MSENSWCYQLDHQVAEMQKSQHPIITFTPFLYEMASFTSISTLPYQTAASYIAVPAVLTRVMPASIK